MIKILIADDHPIVRMGIKQMIADFSDLNVAGEAGSSDEVLHLIRKEDWDVVVLDISMPGRSGIETLKRIKDIKPDLPVLILSMYPEDQYALRLLKAGAAGYMTKETAPDLLVSAIRKVASGKRYVSPALADILAAKMVDKSDAPPHETLSDREYQIFCMLASGKVVSEIALELSLSVKTISTYRARIMDKMHLTKNAELTYYAIKNQLVD